MPVPAPPEPTRATACLALADGTIFRGTGLGASGRSIGEICFNTAMSGYQEIMTDPSYAAQIITFTFPHIGNVGTNPDDIESDVPALRGVVLHADPTEPSNYRAAQHLDTWLRANGLVGIAGVDTRQLTRKIRDAGFQSAGIDHGLINETDLLHEVVGWPGIEGMDLAMEVSCRQTYQWESTTWDPETGFGRLTDRKHRVVAVDYGVKKNILRCLASMGCHVTVVPANTDLDGILRHNPDGVFLSNGPGDPAATGRYAVPVIRELLKHGMPVFGICLGHQLLALALGGKTLKMINGHRGANHPIKNLETGVVEITSQNHGFVVDPDSLPAGVAVTHISLFDKTLAGLRVTGKPVFSVQYHPEASPGPQDSRYLFRHFVDSMRSHAAAH